MRQWPLIDLASDAILYVDDDLVAVDKPAGVLCDASPDPNRDHLGKALQRWVGDDHPEFHAAHRLDLATSGVVLFTRTRAATTSLMQQFQERSVAKHYLAVVHALPDWHVGTTFDRRSYLRHHRGRSEEVRSGGKPASTSFEVLAHDATLGLVRATPATGRTHQLRVHLAAVGAPIVGDDRYGRPDDTSERMWLHADQLTFRHPTTDEEHEIMSRRTLVLRHDRPHEQHR